MNKILPFLLLVLIAAGCSNDKKGGQPGVPDHSMHKSPGAAGDNYSDSVNKGTIYADTLNGSPRLMAMNTISENHVHIDYGSPGVKDRVIWGGLVSYDKVWVSGAHKATSVQFSKPVELAGKRLEAGTYALFTIPGKKEWVVILNSRFDQHLADEYNPAEDLVRLPVQPQPIVMTPRLIYAVKKTGDMSGEIIMIWEKIQITVPFKNIQ